MNSDRLPQRNLAAERRILSAMLQDYRRIADAAVRLKEDEFSSFVNQKTFSLMVGLDAAGKKADSYSVGVAARHANFADDITDAFLFDLSHETSAITEADVAIYAADIHSEWSRREAFQAAQEIGESTFDRTTPTEEMLANAEQRILGIAEKGATVATRHVSQTIKETWVALDERRARGSSISGTATGFLDLDKLTAGWQKSSLIVLGARPSSGKTAFAVNVARHVVVEEKTPVLFVSLEQSDTELTERFLCCQAQVDSHRLRTGRLRQAEAERLHIADDLLSRTPLYIDDKIDQTILQIGANARRIKRKHGVGLVIIDYLQLIAVEGKKENRQEQVAAISRRLKLLARELKIPVMVLAQLNRQSESRSDTRPKLSDLRESGAIEQDADVVVMLHRSDSQERGQHDGLVDLIVAKHRNGPTGGGAADAPASAASPDDALAVPSLLRAIEAELTTVKGMLRTLLAEKGVTDPDYLDSKTLAKRLGISVTTVYRQVTAGDLPEPEKFGSSSRWKWSDVEEAILRRK